MDHLWHLCFAQIINKMWVLARHKVNAPSIIDPKNELPRTSRGKSTQDR